MDIRKAFLDYFVQNDHELIESSPLVPDDDSLLFTNAGMVQFKPIFTGEIPRPKTPRACSSQTCIRAGGKHNDLDNVGYTARHHTFFEMLGNFSFGDYFKRDAIAFAWDFVTNIVGLPKEKLWITIHESDDEANEIWRDYVSQDRIVRMGDKDNFWQMGDTGPCGPCSEIHYDQGEEKFSSDEDYLGGEGDRFLEIWNLVFMQYNRNSNGELLPLPKPSIDTGMGLERIVAIKEGKASNYDTSLFMPLIEKVSQITKTPYVYESGASFRVIADHIRSVVFLLAQGVNFSSDGRGYVLRRILRRAVRHGYLLGLKKAFMYLLVDTLCDIMQDTYVYLKDKRQAIAQTIKLEEERFFATLQSGMELFLAQLSKNEAVFSAEVAFMLYDTYGFPLDLTLDMLKERGISLDMSAYEACMKEQKLRARASWKGAKENLSQDLTKSLIQRFKKNNFVGYDNLSYVAKILAIIDENNQEISHAKAGQTIEILLENTPFYPLGGGQVSDTGEIQGKGRVLDTQKVHSLIFSKVALDNDLSVDEEVLCVVDPSRLETAKHHSATHLLHLALFEILGSHIAQAGSYCDDKKLRFDFTHPKALSSEEIEKIQIFVNRLIKERLVNNSKLLPIDEAKKLGAKALFNEKYDEIVRVVDFGSKSIEFCGGTHVSNTAEIGSFFITKETSVSSGVRRIEAVVGASAYEYAKSFIDENKMALEILKSKSVTSGVQKLQSQIKQLKQDLKQASSKKDLSGVEMGDVYVIIDEGSDPKQVLDLAKTRFSKVAVMIFTPKNDKVLLLAGSKNTSIDASEWLRSVCDEFGGKGGGKKDFASGALNNANIEDVKKYAHQWISTRL